MQIYGSVLGFTDITELVNPILNIKCNSGESVDFMFKEIIKEWEKYLKSKEEVKIKNKE